MGLLCLVCRMSVMMQETECDAGAARLRAEFEVNDALKALKAAIPGSVELPMLARPWIA
jgi:hypothetical protein